MKKVLFTATVDSHILHFHIPYLKLFKDNGYEVHVATNGDEEIPYCDVKHKISFERSPFKLNNLKAIKNLKKVIDNEQFEIIHCHTPMGSVVTRIAAMKARKNGTRVIYTAHGFHFYKGAPILNWCLFYPIEKWLSAYTDTLITINKEDYELAKRKFKKCKDIQYVPGVGIDEEKFNFNMTQEEKNELRKSLGLKEDDYVIIYVAELIKRKNQSMAIIAMKDLVQEYPNIKLLLVGKDSYNGTYQKLVKELKLENNVIFAGYRKDVPQLMKISNLAVSTAKQEGLPVNIMEAMTCKLPVIATDCRGNRDLVINGKNGYLIEINDKKNFVKAIESIYLKKDNLMIEKNKQEASKYTLTSILEEMKKIYFKRKRIIHLLASNDFSGAENVACTIIKETDDSFENFYCSPKGRIKEVLEEKGIKYIGIDKLSYKNLKLILKEYNPDIIHAHDFKASFLASLAYKRVSIISHIHKNDPMMKKISKKSILFLLTSKHFKKIIGVSDSIINEYIFKNNIRRKYVTIYNYINKENIIKLSNEKEIEDKYDIYYFGRLSKEKNPLEFIEIISKLNIPNIKCIMIGDGPLKYECYKKINEYNLNNSINMLGFMNNPYPYIKNSKIGIMPSIYEGFGLTAIEGIVLGKIVLNSGIGGLKEIFLNNKDYICTSKQEYIDKIKDILLNKCTMSNVDISMYCDENEWKNKIKECYKKEKKSDTI